MGRFEFRQICKTDECSLGTNLAEGNLCFYKISHGKIVYITHEQIKEEVKALSLVERTKFDNYTQGRLS